MSIVLQTGYAAGGTVSARHVPKPGNRSLMVQSRSTTAGDLDIFVVLPDGSRSQIGITIALTANTLDRTLITGPVRFVELEFTDTAAAAGSIIIEAIDDAPR